MKNIAMPVKRPWVQIAIDARDIGTAETWARSAAAAGADWIEAGTPLIVHYGIASIQKILEWGAGRPVVADFKLMDGGEKFFRSAHELGASVAVVMGGAPDASIQAAVTAKKACGIKVVVDLLGLGNARAARARETVAMGTDYIMLHLGHDESRADPTKGVLDGLEEVLSAVTVPVGVSTFNKDEAVRAIRIGASFVVQGNPILTSPDRDVELRRFVDAVKSAL
jgi:3-keto-L-gulonate-6-phosphate decarboxylase